VTLRTQKGNEADLDLLPLRDNFISALVAGHRIHKLFFDRELRAVSRGVRNDKKICEGADGSVAHEGRAKRIAVSGRIRVEKNRVSDMSGICVDIWCVDVNRRSYDVGTDLFHSKSIIGYRISELINTSAETAVYEGRQIVGDVGHGVQIAYDSADARRRDKHIDRAQLIIDSADQRRGVLVDGFLSAQGFLETTETGIVLRRKEEGRVGKGDERVAPALVVESAASIGIVMETGEVEGLRRSVVVADDDLLGSCCGDDVVRFIVRELVDDDACTVFEPEPRLIGSRVCGKIGSADELRKSVGDRGLIGEGRAKIDAAVASREQYLVRSDGIVHLILEVQLPQKEGVGVDGLLRHRPLIGWNTKKRNRTVFLRFSGFWFLVSGFWFLVSGFWFLVSGFWFLVSGFYVFV